jgi:hypothetical protein
MHRGNEVNRCSGRGGTGDNWSLMLVERRDVQYMNRYEEWLEIKKSQNREDVSSLEL